MTLNIIYEESVKACNFLMIFTRARSCFLKPLGTPSRVASRHFSAAHPRPERVPCDIAAACVVQTHLSHPATRQRSHGVLPVKCLPATLIIKCFMSTPQHVRPVTRGPGHHSLPLGLTSHATVRFIMLYTPYAFPSLPNVRTR